MTFAVSVAGLPSLFDRDWRDFWDHPYRHLGLEMVHEDFLIPTRPVRSRKQKAALSVAKRDPDQFRVSLDVRHFTPDEVTVKAVDNHVVIHGKHEERADGHGFVSREFIRRYLLPDGVDAETVTCSLTREGTMTVQAPKKAIEEPPSHERVVPITLQETLP